MANPAELRDLALRTAFSIAPELETRTGKVKKTETKSSETDLVTDADRWAEEQIVSKLHDARPKDSILSEEGTQVKGSSGVRWIVDPIDGTTNFVYKYPSFSISIGAEIDNEPVAGVVVAPLLNESFAAALNLGTTLNGNKINVSKTTNLSLSLLATGFAYKAEERYAQVKRLLTIISKIRDIRRIGSAALDLASVACGRVDAYFENGLSYWDIAAGQILVTEAGGMIEKINIQKLNQPNTPTIKNSNSVDTPNDFGVDTLLIASTPEIFYPLIELLNLTFAE